MKKIGLMVLLFIGLTALYACSNSSVYTYIIDESYTEYITMGTSADYPPYEWPKQVEGKTTLVGIDVEIAKHIAKAAGKNLRIVNKGFDFLLSDLASGRVDFVLAGMTPTEERAKQVDFSAIYYEATQVVMIKSQKVETYTSISSLDLKTVKIGAQLGSIQQDLLNEHFLSAQQHIIQNLQNLVMQLKDGQIDALIVEKPVADGYVKQHSDLAIANFLIGDPDGGSAIAVQKGNQALLSIINTVIDKLISSGEMDKIVSDAILLNS